MKGIDVVSEKKRQDDTKRTRQKQIIIRVSDEELKAIHSATQKSGLSRTDFLLSLMHGENIIIIEDLRDICVELKKQGINLNQSLRFAYQTKDPTDLKKAVAACNDLYDQAKALLLKTDTRVRKKKRR